jgi:hypothetical protein
LTLHRGHINNRANRTLGREFYSAQKMHLRRYTDRLSTIPIDGFQLLSIEGVRTLSYAS